MHPLLGVSKANGLCQSTHTHVLIVFPSTQQERRYTMKRLTLFLFPAIALAVTMGLTARAQTPTPTPPTTPAQAVTAMPAANPADVATIDSMVAALYDVISGPPGARNWDRFRSLFIAGARLIPTGRRQTGEVGSRVLSPDDYVQRSAPLIEKNGFFEREISRRTEQFGNIAHIFSTYESRHAKDDAQPFQRGINFAWRPGNALGQHSQLGQEHLRTGRIRHRASGRSAFSSRRGKVTQRIARSLRQERR